MSRDREEKLMVEEEMRRGAIAVSVAYLLMAPFACVIEEE
jgi:hypothetical protein